MKTRPLYDHFTDELRIVPLRADFLLDQEEGLYDDNWIISADDLFGKMELPMTDPNAYQDLVA